MRMTGLTVAAIVACVATTAGAQQGQHAGHMADAKPVATATADIGALGKMLAVAVAATLYGAIVANAIAGPIGDKLALRSSEEILNREMMLQGILSIQAGDNPRVTLDRMMAFIPAAGRAKLQMAA